ncbi:MAG: hypothetical protein ACXIVQ_08295 [Acidimicrobiales bacterium]
MEARQGALGTAFEIAPGTDTSIGSLPHTDPHQAVALVLAAQTRLPAAPSLPQRSPLEGMIAQAAWGIPGVHVAPDGSLDLTLDDLDPAAPLADPGLAGEPFLTLRTFLAAVSGRTTPVKLQLTGPVSLGLALHAAGAEPGRAFAVAGQAVRRRSAELLALGDELAPGTPLVVFLDEPGLTGLLHPRFPIGAEEAIDLTSSALAVLERGAMTGLHCCGPTDWKLVIQAGPQILSAPIGLGLEAASESLGRFLEDGGWVAWGAVPTDEPIGSTPGRLWRQLSASWCDMVQGGCDAVLLRSQSLVTPACGLATHGTSQAERVLGLTRQVAVRVHDQALGVRLAVGA